VGQIFSKYALGSITIEKRFFVSRL